jgi:hypothetical protein
MKRNALLLFVMALLVIGCKNNTPKEVDVEGQIVTLDEFYASPADYKDKEITLTALVDHVCKHGGKKLFLVSDEHDIHVESEEERFTEDLAGKTIELKGIVREFRVDEAYCLKREEDNMQAHRDQKTNEEAFKAEKENIQYYRDSMKVAGVDYLSYWSIDYLSLKELDK